MADPVVITLAGAVGLILGSFGNVVIHRVPRRESIVRPASRCPSCLEPVAPRDNIPVLSYVLLRGRCRRCRAPIGLRYPVVELVTGGLFALTAWRLPATDLIAFLPLMWVLVVLSGIDIDHKLLPNRIVFPSIAVFLALAALASALGPGFDAWLRALGGGAAAFAVLFVIALISPKGMGMGDVKFSLLLGAALGYRSWATVFVGYFLAFVAGALGGVLLIAARRGGMKSQIPFGPYLALGCIVGIFWGPQIARAWLGS